MLQQQQQLEQFLVQIKKKKKMAEIGLKTKGEHLAKVVLLSLFTCIYICCFDPTIIRICFRQPNITVMSARESSSTS